MHPSVQGDILDTLLLIALPASGKSEVRKYLRHAASERGSEFHLGDQVQLDDFPYVHFMRVVDDALAAEGRARVFYPDVEHGFIEGRDWGTLLKLVSEDYAWVRSCARGEDPPPPSANASELMDRLDRAREAVGAPAVLRDLDPALRTAVAGRLEGEADRLHAELFSNRPTTLDGKTIVIEFARGGPDGAGFPLPAPHGYLYSLAQLAPELLERAAILYIWVSPEESRRKNSARADPDDPGSILHHSVPIDVMLGDYGTCDLGWLLEQSDKPNTVRIEAAGRTFHLPVGRFDNRVDRTSFIRDAPEDWSDEDVAALHDGLAAAFTAVWSAATS